MDPNNTNVTTCYPLANNCRVFDPTAQSCALCVDNSIKTTDGIICLPSIDNCSKYNNSSFLSNSLTCSTCKSGFVVSTDFSSCQSTGIVNCATASSTDKNICSTCNSGFTLTTDKKACITSIANCQTYSTSTSASISLTCTACVSDFNLQNNICVRQGIQNCMIYNAALKTCSACYEDYELTDDMGGCLADIPFCVDFASSTGTDAFFYCQQCANGFHITDDKRLCLNNLRNCLVYGPSSYQSKTMSCATCSPAYVVAADGTCVNKQISYCTRIDTVTGVCTGCLSAHKLTDDNLACLDEIVNCATYAASNSTMTQLTCKACNGTTILQNNQCNNGTVYYCDTFDSTGKKCVTCQAGRQVTSDGLKCLPKILNCATYSSSTINTTSLVCSTCVQNYQLFANNTVCAVKVNGCVTYHQDLYICTSCSTGLQVTTDGSSCLPIIPLCVVYSASYSTTAALQCSECKQGYVPSSTAYSCDTKVIQDCATMNPDTGKCITCSKNFRPTDDGEVCLPVVENCAIYQTSSQFSTVLQCIGCNAGYQLQAIYCLLRPIPFCDVRNNQTALCDTCLDGWVLTDDKEACLDNIENCAAYTPSNKDTTKLTCKNCESGFLTFNNGTICANDIPHCANYNTDYFYCESCEAGWQITTDLETCLPAISNCETYARSYSATPELLCQDCIDGFTLSTDTKSCSVSSTTNSRVLAIVKSFDSDVNQRRNSYADEGNYDEDCGLHFKITDDKMKCLREVTGCVLYKKSGTDSIRHECLECREDYALMADGAVCLWIGNVDVRFS